MNRLRAIFLLLGLLFVTALMCSGLVFLLAGDSIVNLARNAPAQINVWLSQGELNESVSENTDPTRFVISQGQTAGIIAQNLVAQDLIRNQDLFVDYVQAEGLDDELEAGIYFLNQAQTLREIALALTDSSLSQITFRIIPGWRIEQVAESIDANPLFGFSGDAFLAVVGRGAQVDPQFAQFVGLPAGMSLEGFLLPDTYSLPPEITPEDLRDVLLESFELAIDPQWVIDAQNRGLSLYEAVILGSIIQREAIHVDEYTMISSVYNNRIDIDMRLDADPTVQYPLGQPGDWWPRITVNDYQGVISDYNTYRTTELPPGPIANPSVSAIRAAIYPDESAFFYFRADCRSDGYHDFARTYEEHLANGC